MTTIETTTTTVQRPEPEYFADEAQLPAAAFLARYSGRTLDAYRQDLRGFVQWTADVSLAVLEATRPHIELYRSSLEERMTERPRTHGLRWRSGSLISTTGRCVVASELMSSTSISDSTWGLRLGVWSMSGAGPGTRACRSHGRATRSRSWIHQGRCSSAHPATGRRG
jgi:hypothetical protein